MLKKHSLLTLNLLMILGICLSQVHAAREHIEAFLERETAEFDRAATPTAKYTIVSNPFNLTYLEELESNQEIDPQELRRHVSSDLFDNGERRVNCDKSNLLMLAISLSRETLVCKFLPFVPNVNDSELTAWGYRQPYNLAHMALDPNFPRAQPPSALPNRLGIIDALGERGCDFNFVPPYARIGIYQNPPLAAGEPAGRYGEDTNSLRARALLYGADPSIGGSSFRSIDLSRDWGRGYPAPYSYYSELLTPAFDFFVERMNEGRGVYLRPVPAVIGYFETIARERGMQWPIVRISSAVVGASNSSDEIAEIALRLNKLAPQIHGKEREVNLLSVQRTKNAKNKLRHLILIKEALEKEAKALTRRLRKLSAK